MFDSGGDLLWERVESGMVHNFNPNFTPNLSQFNPENCNRRSHPTQPRHRSDRWFPTRMTSTSSTCRYYYYQKQTAFFPFDSNRVVVGVVGGCTQHEGEAALVPKVPLYVAGEFNPNMTQLNPYSHNLTLSYPND